MAEHGQHLLSIGPEDIGGRYTVEVKLKPELPQDRLQRITMAAQILNMFVQARKEPPLAWVFTEVLEYENVDEIMEAAEIAKWEGLPEVQQWKAEAFLKEWRKTHKVEGQGELERMLKVFSQKMSPEQLAEFSMMLGQAAQMAMAGRQEQLAGARALPGTAGEIPPESQAPEGMAEDAAIAAAARLVPPPPGGVPPGGLG